MTHDFDELDSLLNEAFETQRKTAQLRERQRKLASGGEDLDMEELIADIARLEDTVMWRSVANVALLRVADCAVCGNVTEWFEGWFQEQVHRNLRDSRRLVSGRHPGGYPVHIERHFAGKFATCPACLEKHPALNTAQLSFEFEERSHEAA